MLQGLRVARATPLAELYQWGRLTSAITMITVQVFLTWCLWRALYLGTGRSAGLTADQAVTFAVLAVLHGRIRWTERRGFSRDSMLQQVREGSIMYWYLRPMPPRRFYLVKTAGELAYGSCWALAGYLGCLAGGLVDPPASAAAGLAFAASMLLGQVILYHLSLAVDLFCFWTVVNYNALIIYRFTSNMLSGAFAPLWYFPAWFITAAAWLPFQSTLNVPLSLYVGRMPVSQAPRQLALQVAWCVGLAVATRLLWRRAGERVTVQGG